MFYNTMQIFSKIIDFLNPFGLNPYKVSVHSYGPNTLSELLSQFDQPKKEKTKEDVVRDYLVNETMAKLEVDMLKMEPTKFYKGQQIYRNDNGISFYDWVPCSVRPEILYCCYGKN